MGNAKDEKAEKGSKKQLQMWVTERQDELNQLVISSTPSLLAFGAKKITWVSPLKDDEDKGEYYEYRDDFLNAFGLADGYLEEVRSFWPAGGPQWDGLAIVEREMGRGFLLVEAKAHPEEAYSSMGAKADESISKIERAFTETQQYMRLPEADWTKGYYQFGNRIAFLYLMNVRLGLPTWLVLVNFLNDTTYKPTKPADWVKAEREMFSHLGLEPDSPLMNRIVIVHPQAIEI